MDVAGSDARLRVLLDAGGEVIWVTAPILDIPELIATVRRHQDIVEVWRVMKERLGLTNEFCDDVGGLTKGHTDKLLGPSESKKWGPTTFDLFCEMFAIEFRVHIDLDAVKRMEAVWEGRERPLYPNAQVKRISKKLIERAKPYVCRENASAGGLKRAASLPAKLRSRIARKGGKSRMKKATKEQRSVMALKGWQTRRLRISAPPEPCATLLPAPHPDFPAPECLLPSAG